MVREITGFDNTAEQLVVHLYPQDELGPMLQAAGIALRCLELHSSNSGWNWPAGVMRLRKVIRDFGPDVIHSSLASANLVAQLATVGSRLPVLSTFTLSGDVGLMRSYQPGAASRRAAFLRWLGSHAARRRSVWFRAITRDALVTNCRAIGVGTSRGWVIPRGVPIMSSDASPVSPGDLDLPEGVPIILNVGRQTAQKGHVHLVEAFATVTRHREAHLVILGREGDATSALRASIDVEAVADRVTVIPYTNSPFDYYRVADIFVFPSLMEGLGTAVLEAMASGLPVVAYDIPPVREASGGPDYARLVPLGDVPSLAEAIADILDHPDPANAIAREAKDRVIRDFSVDVVAARLQARLAGLVSASGGM